MALYFSAEKLVLVAARHARQSASELVWKQPNTLLKCLLPIPRVLIRFFPEHLFPMQMSRILSVDAEPYEFEFEPARCALLIIDMQRDFLEPGGFGEMLGNAVSELRRTIDPNRKLLAAWRSAGLQVIHTREGHRPDLADLPPAKKIRGHSKTSIGDQGPMGRILVRGEPGHDIIPELYPLPGEPVIDKPGKGAFFATDLHTILQNRGIQQLVVTGVTTEVCVHTSVREANDRGYNCLVPEDCVGSYFPEFQEMGLKMIKAQGGIFGWVSDSGRILAALEQSTIWKFGTKSEEEGGK